MQQRIIHPSSHTLLFTSTCKTFSAIQVMLSSPIFSISNNHQLRYNSKRYYDRAKKEK